jgi:plasmid stabilization system protein ParE
MSWQDKLARAAQDDAYAISEIMRAKSVYNADMATGNTDGAQAAHKYADQLRTANPRVGSNPLYMDTGGFTGNGEGLAYLHSKELVLNKIDTSNILKVVDFTRDLIGRIKTPDFSSIIPKLNGSANTNLTINLGGINVTGDQKGGQTVLDTIVNGARRMGVNINKT